MSPDFKTSYEKRVRRANAKTNYWKKKYTREEQDNHATKLRWLEARAEVERLRVRLEQAGLELEQVTAKLIQAERRVAVLEQGNRIPWLDPARPEWGYWREDGTVAFMRREHDRELHTEGAPGAGLAGGDRGRRSMAALRAI